MSNVIAFKSRVDNYFGGCPLCGGRYAYLNDGPDHWLTCDKH